jgi:hypothetical protein
MLLCSFEELKRLKVLSRHLIITRLVTSDRTNGRSRSVGLSLNVWKYYLNVFTSPCHYTTWWPVIKRNVSVISHDASRSDGLQSLSSNVWISIWKYHLERVQVSPCHYMTGESRRQYGLNDFVYPWQPLGWIPMLHHPKPPYGERANNYTSVNNESCSQWHIARTVYIGRCSKQTLNRFFFWKNTCCGKCCRIEDMLWRMLWGEQYLALSTRGDRDVLGCFERNTDLLNMKFIDKTKDTERSWKAIHEFRCRDDRLRIWITHNRL